VDGEFKRRVGGRSERKWCMWWVGLGGERTGRGVENGDGIVSMVFKYFVVWRGF